MNFNLLGTEQRVNKIRSVLEKRQPDFSLVLENVHDPHNLSAVLRSCDAVGILEVCLLYHSGQVEPGIADSSSASARKWLNFKHFNSVINCFNYLRQSGKKIYTTHLGKPAKDLYEMDLTEPIALVFGNEHSGVSDEAYELADGNFLIPQMGMVQSLNISVAAAISVYEVFRQKRIAGHYQKPKLPAEQLNSMLREWLLK